MSLAWLALLSVCVVASGEASAQSPAGSVREDLSLDSEILGTTVKYAIYLPSDYTTSERSYPVVYLLHGGNGDDMLMRRMGIAHEYRVNDGGQEWSYARTSLEDGLRFVGEGFR